MNATRKKEMEITRKEISKELNQFRNYFEDSNLQKIVFGSFEEKVKKISVRGYFVRKIYEYVVDCMKIENIPLKNQKNLSPIFNQKLPFLAEAVINVQYKHNQILDGKMGVNDIEKIKETLIGANVLKDKIYDYIDDNFDCYIASIVHKYVRKMFKHCDYGQYMDKKSNNYKNYQCKNFEIPVIKNSIDNFTQLKAIRPIINKLKQEVPNKDAFIEAYFNRIYLTSAALFILSTELILELTGYNGKEKENILNFARSYGLMLQIVNDNCDFIVDSDMAAGKNKNDYCKDTENKNITLPLMYYLANRDKYHLDGEIKDYLDNTSHYLNKKEAFKEMVTSKSIFKSIRKGAKIGSLASRYLPYTKDDSPLQNLLAICTSNRFYFHCFSAKKYFNSCDEYDFDEHSSIKKQKGYQQKDSTTSSAKAVNSLSNSNIREFMDNKNSSSKKPIHL